MLVFRAWPLRSLHVVGTTPMAEALRGLIAAGAAPGWELHPVPGGRPALQVLAASLYRLSGEQRFYNLLDRAGKPGAEPPGDHVRRLPLQHRAARQATTERAGGGLDVDSLRL